MLRILSYLRKLDSARRDRKERPEVTAFKDVIARLSRSDVAIDCGANLGKFTTLMAETGATVYAFEPHPVAYEQLVSRMKSYPNVTVFHAAVAAEAGNVRLYFHKWTKHDPLHWSSSASLLSTKENIDRESFVDVKAIPLAAFIEKLDRPVALLKMDIEGAEVAVLNQLLDAGLAKKIGEAFVEVHDRRVRSLVEPTQRLRERFASLGITNFRLDWR